MGDRQADSSAGCDEQVLTAAGDASSEPQASTAVVLYDDPSAYVTLQWLGPDIDLKVPPHNWMRGGLPLERYIQKLLRSKNSAMSSVNMAMSNIDMVDHVDVISDSKNIKSLLQIPFDNSKPVSLMVHRVGKTLLIDDFDIHKHLLRQQKDDWAWMRDFYLSLVNNEQVARYPRVAKTQKELMNRNMFSKFLYYSISSGSESPLVSTHSQSEPVNIDETTDNTDDHTRTLQWSIEDIKMLIGTDLPIFREDSSCISLRLQDANDPITVLTGLEYWLDNLMCNVPEIAMCYHLNGFIQRYERHQTSEIPEFSGAEFKPNYVKDMAQNILSFLKSKATKVGHTYWLYKEKDGDIVKLYDLTSLCDEDSAQQDPFRLPLAHLLYCVAVNIHKKHSRKKSGLIDALLKNCLILLNGERPQITATAYKLLCELYLSGSDDECESSSSSDEEDADETEESAIDNEKTSSNCQQLNVTKLLVPSSAELKDAARFPPISGSCDSKCAIAVNHSAMGLKVVDVDFESIDSKQNLPKTAIPTEAIPLPYEPLKKEKALCDDSSDDLPSLVTSKSAVQLIQERNTRLRHTWHRQAKATLLEMATNAYFKLADSANLLMDFGSALKYIKMALISFDALRFLAPSDELDEEKLLYILRLCGDIQLKLASKQLVEVYLSSYIGLSPDDQVIIDSCSKHVLYSGFEWAYKFYHSAEKRFLMSLQCYQQCSDIEERLNVNSEKLATSRRVGNCHNELATFYMNLASNLINVDYSSGDNTRAEQIEELLSASGANLEKGISYFTSIADKKNISLLLSNHGRLLRIKAQTLNSTERGEFTEVERQLYEQAAEKYLEALHILSKRENCVQIWDLVTFELAGVHCTIASLLQDFTPLSTLPREEIERDVTDQMLKALKYCDSGDSSENMRKYRSATIHHRLASLFHNAYRIENLDQKLKHLKSMTESHYTKAANLFHQLESHIELFRVQLEMVALHEFEMSNMTSPNSKIKVMVSALSVLLSARVGACFHTFSKMSDGASNDWQEMVKLLSIYSSRLQFILLQLVKCSGEKKAKASHIQGKYKDMYRIALRLNSTSDKIPGKKEMEHPAISTAETFHILNTMFTDR